MTCRKYQVEVRSCACKILGKISLIILGIFNIPSSMSKCWNFAFWYRMLEFFWLAGKKIPCWWFAIVSLSHCFTQQFFQSAKDYASCFQTMSVPTGVHIAKPCKHRNIMIIYQLQVQNGQVFDGPSFWRTSLLTLITAAIEFSLIIYNNLNFKGRSACRGFVRLRE